MPVKPGLLVKHSTGHYPIFIESGLCERAGTHIEVLSGSGSLVVVTDSTVRNLHGDCFLNGCDSDPIVIEIEPGEASKSVENYRHICTQLVEGSFDRRTLVVALGGGVVGDLAGFVAATYLRGVRVIQVPTTLLAQVDSSVGGKTAINLPQSKNCIGAFWQPNAVYIDPAVLNTLEPKEYTAGLAEVVKMAVILDDEMFEFLETEVDEINNHDLPTLERIILRCCQLKAEVVEEDEKETTGRRVILNYGHTFGHAIETAFGYGTWPHGHAVAMGMHAAAQLSRLLDRVDDEFVNRQYRLLSQLNIPACFPADRHEVLWEDMQRDKKTLGGEVRFVLPDRLGHVELVDSIDPAAVMEAMRLASVPRTGD
ncbi:MAG: 3-dehydroquinate synthase [Pirellulaceae bacterium]